MVPIHYHADIIRNKISDGCNDISVSPSKRPKGILTEGVIVGKDFYQRSLENNDDPLGNPQVRNDLKQRPKGGKIED